MPQGAEPKARSLAFLSLVCFAVADVQDGLGPFLGVYLQGRGWAPDEIGYAMTAGGLAGMALATPFGALADRTRRKRLLLGAAVGGIVLACAAVLPWTGAAAVWTSKIAQGALAAAIAPLLASITLGLVGQDRLPARLGKNEAWNHFGNCATAVLGGLGGYFFGFSGVLAVLALMGATVLVCLAFINPAEIDYAVARGLEGAGGPAAPPGGKRPAPLRRLFGDRALLAVAGVLFFFHLGNAAMLPLLGQAAVARFAVHPEVYTAGTVFIAQTTMIAAALWAARTAVRRGYGILFVIALAALPARGLAAGFLDSAWSIIPVQLLDGVGAGLMGVATPGIVARLLKGSGHVNMGLGLALTLQGVGAALSSSYGGLLAGRLSYGAAFLGLGLAPCLGLGLFVFACRRLPRLRECAASFARRG